MAKLLSRQFYEDMKKLEGRYPSRLALLLPALHAVQAEMGWLPAAALDEVAEYLGVSPARVRETASFYSMFQFKPPGKYTLRLCTNASCCLRGADRMLEFLQKELQINPGDTTADKRFTLIEEECLGACGHAPVLMVDDVYHEDLTFLELQKLIERLE